MAYLFILYHTIARILCIRKPATGGLPGRRRSPLCIYYYILILQRTPSVPRLLTENTGVRR